MGLIYCLLFKNKEVNMNKQEYIEKLQSFNFDPERFCIIAGGILLMRGLRETTDDIDIKMSPDYFAEIRTKSPVKKSPKYDYLWEIEDIEVAVQELDPEKIRHVDGFQAESLQSQLDWYKANGRAKDANIIKKLEQHLALHPED